MPGIGWLKIIKRPLAITAAMLWAMWLGIQVNVIVGLILGVGVYILGLWVMRIFGEEERQILISLLPESLGSRISLVNSKSEE